MRPPPSTASPQSVLGSAFRDECELACGLGGRGFPRRAEYGGVWELACRGGSRVRAPACTLCTAPPPAADFRATLRGGHDGFVHQISPRQMRRANRLAISTEQILVALGRSGAEQWWAWRCAPFRRPLAVSRTLVRHLRLAPGAAQPNNLRPTTRAAGQSNSHPIGQTTKYT